MKPRGRWTFTFRYAAAGIWYSIRTQRNMMVHVAVALVAIIAAVLFQLPLISWAILLLVCAVVIGLELINTAIETVVDLITEEYHPLAKIVKDTAAGAVLIAAVLAVIIGCLIFYEPIKQFFGWV